MNFYAISALVNLITGACLCLAILSKEKRNKIDLYFALFAFSACVWSAGYFFWQIATSFSSALFWSRLLIAGAIGIGAAYFHFIFEFLNFTETKKNLLRLVDVLFLLLFITDFTPLMVKSVEPKLFFPFWPIPGAAFHIYLASWLGLIAYSTFLLYKTYKVSQGIFKKQIRYLFWGVFIGFIAGSINYLLWYNIPIPPITNILVCLYFILVFYSIVRYRFFDIKVIATEFFVLILLAATIWQLYVPNIIDNIFLASAFICLVLIAGIFLIRSVVREVTQKEQLQVLTRQLEGANEQLKILDQARAEFITIASHQLRTPPATIKWYLAAILAGDYGKFDDSVKDQLRKTMSTNNSMISLIDDLLNASRIERGKMEFIFQPTDLNEITQVTVDQLLPQAEMKKLQLVYQKPAEAMPVITADKEKLRQVINNLIDNAIKYTQQGKILVEIGKTKKDLFFKVTDSGRGVSKDQLKGIFQKYDRGKSAPRNSSGLGLGLYVAKVIIEQHKGKIWVESKGEGKGSTFNFTVPIGAKLENTTFDLTKSQKPTS